MSVYSNKRFFIWLSLAIAICMQLCASGDCMAQPNPPHPVTIYGYPEQSLQFGAFTHGLMGGSITVSPSGFRSTTGDVVQLSLGHTFSAALFDVEGEPGTRIHIMLGPDVVLTSNTGGTMTLHLGDTDPVSPFILTTTPPARTQVRIGGTLTVGNQLVNPPGSYNGIFTITFIQE